MKTDSKNNSHRVTFKLIECRYGMLYFQIGLGNQSFKSNFSAALDPIPMLRSWLEAIAVGVWQCSFSFDPEGNDVQFDYHCSRFIISYPGERPEVQPFIMGYPSRRQLVETFYRGLLGLYDNPKFDRWLWDPKLLSDELTEREGLGYYELVEKLVCLPSVEVIAIKKEFFGVPFVSDESGEFQYEFGFDEDGEIVLSEVERPVEKPRRSLYSQVPYNYNGWTTIRKLEYITQLLGYVVDPGGYGGKLSDLRSPIIETFLNKRE